MPGSGQSQSKNWCFTINNPTDNDKKLLKDAFDDGAIVYVCYQMERGANGTEHMQGHCVFAARKRLNAVKAFLPRAHLEVRKGSFRQAEDYATKADTRIAEPVRLGDPSDFSNQGNRTDLDDIKKRVRDGDSMLSIFEAHFGTALRYHRGIERYRVLLRQASHRDRPEVLVLHGPSGIGKSRYVRQEWPNAFYLQRPRENRGAPWWDGYDGEDTVVLDDFYGWIPYSTLLNALDYGPFRGETKGGTVPVSAHRFIITSNVCSERWYSPVIVGEARALARRISEFGCEVNCGIPGWQEEISRGLAIQWPSKGGGPQVVAGNDSSEAVRPNGE